MFETERLLPPFDDASEDTLEARNVWYQQRGLSPDYLVFHEGLTLSAVSQVDGLIVTIATIGVGERARFSSLEDWYQCLLRAEYAERYGLVSLPQPHNG